MKTMKTTQNVHIYDEYEYYLRNYQKEYGDNVVVLMMVGSFYEMYSIDNGLFDIHSVADLLNIQVSKRNKNIAEVSKSNAKMCGFPAYCLQKYTNLLVDNMYTVIVISQITPPPKPKRGVTMIVSPGTRIDDIPYVESNNLVTIYLESFFDIVTKKRVYGVGATSIDVTTGVCKVYETWGKPFDDTLCSDNVYRFLLSECPKEIILINTTEMSNNKLVSMWELEKTYVHYRDSIDKEIQDTKYQNQFLKRVFPNHGIYSPIEYIDLENKKLGLTSLIACLQFAYRHSENILDDIRPPQIIEDKDNLVLSYNCIKQLDVLTLLSHLNNSHTAIGKRYFKDRLLNPIKCVEKLDAEYDKIENVLADTQGIGKLLSNISDLERLFKKITLNTIHPADFNNIHCSISSLLRIYEVYSRLGLIPEDVNRICKNMIEIIDKSLDLDEVQKYHRDNISRSFYKIGFDSEIDTLSNGVTSLEMFFENFVKYLNQTLAQEFFKIDYNERDGYFITITNKRYKDVYNNLKDIVYDFGEYRIVFKDIETRKISNTSTSSRLSYKVFDDINDHIQELKGRLKDRVLSVFNNQVKSFHDEFYCAFGSIVDTIANVDYITTNAKNAIKYLYKRPYIDRSQSSKPFVKACKMRHPIIERILNSTEYIPNDIEMGCDYDGILLYGINSAGKSSLMKAIGLNMIMACAGMYVPCESMTFSPYDAIYTRIPSGDSISKGQSTFTCEVAELRNILKRADERSLVIGDELCSGTESVSALSIVSAGIVELCKRRCSWIFASHLHDLMNIPHVKNLSNMSVKHLSVRYDEGNKCLVYDRKLKDGQGQTIYGLEVCKALDLDPNFLMLATEIRHHIMGIESNIVSTKKTRYNKAFYKEPCYFCKRPSREVHHIKQQKDADMNGYIDNVHKNGIFNLLNVCESCHDDIHANKIVIDGFMVTSNGTGLQFTRKK